MITLNYNFLSMNFILFVSDLNFARVQNCIKDKKRSSIVLKSFCPISVSYVVSEIKKKETEALCHYSESSNIKVNKWHQLQLCSGHNVLVWFGLTYFHHEYYPSSSRIIKPLPSPPLKNLFETFLCSFQGPCKFTI